MIDRFLIWLAQKASNYLVWMHEREVRDAPICPDCDLPEPDCCCAENFRRDREMESYADEVARTVWEEAQREFGVPW